MTKRFLSLFLALALCMGLAVPAFAAGDKPQRGVLTCTEHIAPQYEDAQTFSEGLAAVKKDGKWGYIDEDNNVVIPFQYDYTWGFDEGYAVVAKAISTTPEEEDDYATYSYYMKAEIGFIDQDNRYTAFTDLYADYDDDWNFVPGPLTITFRNVVYDYGDGYTDEYRFVPEEETLMFHNGFAVIDYHLFRTDGSQVEITRDTQWGPEICGPIGPVNEGLVPITSLGGEGLDDYGWADTNGNVVRFFLDDPYPGYDISIVRSFNQGLAPVWAYIYDENGDYDENEYCGIMDRSFQWVIRPSYDRHMVSNSTSEYKVFGVTGLLLVKDFNGKWGGVDKNGKTVLPFRYDGLYPYSQGLAAFKENGKWGFIDDKGQVAIPAQYVIVSSFSGNGYAVAYDGQNAFLIDKTGKEIPGTDQLDPSTYFAWDKDDDIPTVYTPGTYVVIEKDGKYGFGKVDYLPELPKQGDTDSWAYDEVVEAIEEELVPTYLQNLYRQNITREEFCDLIVQAVSEALDKDVEALVLERSGKTLTALRQEYKFNDTTSANVAAAYALGIVKGTSDTTFNPYGQITRQEAATMLARAARLLGLKAGTGISFNDAGSFASWAKDEISFVSGLVDPVSNNRVMNGVSSDRFDPASSYTREQAILTILRLFHCAEK